MKNASHYFPFLLFLAWSCSPAEKGIGEGPFAGLSRIELPVEFPAGAGAPPPPTPVLEDSALIVKFINPGYFQEKGSPYSYHEGLVVMEKRQFIAVVYPIAHGFGCDYQLYTYTPSGERVDTLTLAKSAEDYYEQSARIDLKGRIRTRRVYLDGSRHPLWFAYTISAKGEIEQVPVVKPRGAGLLKEWGVQ